jgi:hypothetical protein
MLLFKMCALSPAMDLKLITPLNKFEDVVYSISMNLHVEVKLKTNTTWSEQVQKFNPKNQSETKIDIPNTHIQDHALS